MVSHLQRSSSRHLSHSIEEHSLDVKKRQLLREQEDGSELFRAALRASTMDLGPRGISQAAKIMATGDQGLGQARVLAKRPESRTSLKSFKSYLFKLIIRLFKWAI